MDLRGKRVFVEVRPSVLTSLRNILTFGKELQRRRINAVSQSRRRWPVGKNMALMASAPRTPDLRAPHSVTVIVDIDEVLPIDGQEERWPARPGIKFRIGFEQRQSAQAARIRTRFFVIGQITAERWFRAVIE